MVTRKPNLFLLAIVTLSLAGLAHHPAQAQSATGTTLLERDSTAVGLMEQAIAATGGKGRIKAMSDFRATGTIVFSWADKDVPGEVVIQGRGKDQARMDVHLADSDQATVINRGHGAITDHTGTHELLPQNASHMGLLIMAVPRLVHALEDPNVGISLHGTEMVGGDAAYRIDLEQGNLPKAARADSRLRQLRTTQIFIDTNTLMVVQIRYPYVFHDRKNTAIIRQLTFSDFRKVSGLLLPFTVDESHMDQHVSTLHLTTIELNSGVSSAVFER